MNLTYFLLLTVIIIAAENKNIYFNRTKRLAISSIQSEVEEFLIYRYITDSLGYCLIAGGNGNVSIKLFLSPFCLKGNPAARWKHLKGYLFLNVKFSKCLSAKVNNINTVNGLLTLDLCDPQDYYQTWKCDEVCHLSLRQTINSGKYNLDHVERTNSLHVVPFLRVGFNFPTAKWIIHDKGNKVSQCVCNAIAVEQGLKSQIITGGGNRGIVGKPCVFPFISDGVDVWECTKTGDQDVRFCGVVRNLDKDKSKWGLCPADKRGTFSEWLPPPMCDKPCGSGRIIKKRKCLYTPCDGPLKGVQEGSCNDQPCTGEYILTAGGQSSMFPIDGLLSLVEHGPISVCKFPFVYNGVHINNCVSNAKRSRGWCSLTTNYDIHKKWGFCLEETKGMWTNWASDDEMLCSTTCGGGRMLKTRACYNPPCKGSSQMTGESCNTLPCPECYEGRGENYKGDTRVTRDGFSCVESRLCRNDRTTDSYPWCLARIAGINQRSYCDLIPCSKKMFGFGIPYTFPLGRYNSASIEQGCQFPYFYKGFHYDACLKLLVNSTTSKEKCQVFANGRKELRYCPSFFSGKWSVWEYGGDCTKSCGGGFQIMFRRCLLAKCIGSSIRIIKSKKCNTFPCTWDQIGTEDCYTGRGIMYEGTASKTILGEGCKLWGPFYPYPPYIYNNDLPKDFPRLVENYCRNPMPHVYRSPWCSTTSGWQYCDIPRCPTKEGEIFPLPHPMSKLLFLSDQPCQFPFVGADNKLHSECIAISYKGFTKYCSIDIHTNLKSLLSNPIEPFKHRDQKIRQTEMEKIARNLLMGYSHVFAICPSSVQGTWSSWSLKEECSVDCGGGVMVRTRLCLYPPCSKEKSSHRTKIPCNEHPCPKCLIGSGKWYRGNINVGYNGKTCMKWSEVNNYMTEFHQQKYKELEGNFCRNPGGMYPIPWCFMHTNEIDTIIRLFCDIPHCDDNFLKTIPFTIPDHEYTAYNQQGWPCRFPYKFDNQWYSSCINSSKEGKYLFCSVKKYPENSALNFAICPPHYKGKWSIWRNTGTCSRPCGSSQQLFIRDCLYPPCIGARFKFNGTCTLPKCRVKFNESLVCYVGNGKSYTGFVSQTIGGIQCANWNDPHLKHWYFGVGTQLIDNACRNPSPGLFRIAPWCYILDENWRQKWLYCNIQKCTKYVGEIITLGGPAVGHPCFFPFVDDEFKRYERCKKLEENTNVDGVFLSPETRYYCKVAKDQNFPDVMLQMWGICPSSYEGTLSSWSLVHGEHFCSKNCGGGRLVYKRHCRYEPCKSNVTYTKLAGSCNKQPCNDDCVVGNGQTYKGNFTFVHKTKKCLKWKDLDLREFELADSLTSADNNFCRNIAPSRYHLPFCLISATEVAVCDIPPCSPIDYIPGVGIGVDGSRCEFPYIFHNGWHKRCMYEHDDPADFVCNRVPGTRKFKICSKFSQGFWGEWAETGHCSEPCGGGTKFYRRYCRYKPCHGNSTKEEGLCNDFPCNKTSNCYDVRTNGVEFRSNDKKFTGEDGCLKTDGYACFNYKEEKDRLARPVCRFNYYRRMINKSCLVRPCPNSASGPIMVQPLLGFEKRPLSPCIFPFFYNNVNHTQCLLETVIPPPTAPRYRERVSTRWCSTLYDVRKDLMEWGYCTPTDQGKWGNWLSEKCSGSCLMFRLRYCHFPVCIGNKWKFSFHRCSNPKCPKFVWNEWEKWSDCGKCSHVRTRYRTCLYKQLGVIQTVAEAQKHCQGHSSQFERCKHALLPDCTKIYVFGQTSDYEVKALTQAYGLKVLLESSATSLNRKRFSTNHLVLLICYGLTIISDFL